MGRKRKSDTGFTFEEIIYIMLISPIIILCKYPILLIPIIVLLIFLYANLIDDIIKYYKDRKNQKLNEKLLQEQVEKMNRKDEQNKVVEVEILEKEIKEETTPKENLKDLFYEILKICSDIEDKLLKVKMLYKEEKENNKLDEIYYELESYDKIIEKYRNTKLIDLNNNLYQEVKTSYEKFLSLYEDFFKIIKNRTKRVSLQEIDSIYNSK